MAQSSASKALASLSYKFQAKIREVGNLKAQVKRLTNDTAKDIAQAEVVQKLQTELERQVLRSDTLSNDFMKQSRELQLVEMARAQAEAAYKRLQAHVSDVEGLLKDQKSSASNWKSFTPIAIILGAVTGVLSTAAYVVQTSPL